MGDDDPRDDDSDNVVDLAGARARTQGLSHPQAGTGADPLVCWIPGVEKAPAFSVPHDPMPLGAPRAGGSPSGSRCPRGLGTSSTGREPDGGPARGRRPPAPFSDRPCSYAAPLRPGTSPWPRLRSSCPPASPRTRYRTQGGPFWTMRLIGLGRSCMGRDCASTDDDRISCISRTASSSLSQPLLDPRRKSPALLNAVMRSRDGAQPFSRFRRQPM